MNINSTYRVQLHNDFTFQDLKNIIPYLHDLGITTIYASPIFSSMPNSTHGYDVTNPHLIDPEIGTFDELRELSKELHSRGMNWIQDIVPNHMAYSHHNIFLRDLFEKGPQSFYYDYFDINFEIHLPRLKGKVIAPFLGDKLENVIEKRELQPALTQEGLCLKYYEQKFFLNIPTYKKILSQLNGNNETYPHIKALLPELENEDLYIDSSTRWEEFKEELYHIYLKDGATKEAINKKLKELQEPVQMKQLIDEQYFRPEYWRISEKEINYRRFFTINGLICLRMREEKVFQHYHRFLKELVDEGLVQGVRIDHVDGLYDPVEYLKRLRELLGDDIYIIVEKILEAEENLHFDWPVEGTSGYDFLGYVNQLFTNEQHERQFNELYKKLVPQMKDYQDVIFQKKMLILMNYMSGEFDNMLYLLERLGLIPSQFNDEELKLFIEAFAIYLVSYPVYRIHGNDYPLPDEDIEMLDEVFVRAEQRAPKLQKYFDVLKKIFNLRNEENPDHYREKLRFFLRCQQLAVPLTAKGVEDTTFYVYNKFIAHNEVGDSPEIFGIAVQDFHRQMLHRQETQPRTINATATHDTKRGEDVRMRLNALSEIPDEWEKKMEQWLQKDDEKREGLFNNDIYFMLQTLVGMWPEHMEKADEELKDRLKEYIQKSLREGKEHSRWAEPNEVYEQKMVKYITTLISNDQFMQFFLPFQKKIMKAGALNSLAQSLLKITSPGIPDIYQGSELWDLSLVDPDNRRPVNYESREKLLQQFKSAGDNIYNALAVNIFKPAIKLFVIHHALQLRNKYPDIFSGKYTPVEVNGEYSDNIVAFIRQHENQKILVAVPCKMSVTLASEQGFKWKNTLLTLPGQEQWKNIFTGKNIPLSTEVTADELFADFPVVLLKNIDG